MSSADPEEVSVVVERDGVTVEKSFEPDDFPVPAIAFVIRSERDEAVEVTLTDEVPDDIEAEDIGFHPKYGADHWSNDQGKLVFEREFEAGEEYTTVYGLRARDTEDVERFLGEPTLERVHPEAPDEEDAGKVVSDVMNEGETLELNDPSGGGVEASDDDLEAAIAAADVSDEQAAQAAAVDAPDASADSGGDGTRPPVTLSGEEVVSMLAAGVRSGAVSDEDLATLRQALGTDGADGSVKARISHLQTEVSDLQAYTSALEEFLDENGEAQELLRDLQTTVEGFEDELADVRTEVTAVSDDVAGATAKVDEVNGEVADLQASVQSVDDRLENVQSDVGEVRSDLETLRSEVGSVRDDVDSVERDVESVRDEIPDGELEGLDDRVAEMDDRMADLETELEDLAQMRERMATVFGGAGAGAGGAGGTDEDETDDEE